jgi:hypothetical protein
MRMKWSVVGCATALLTSSLTMGANLLQDPTFSEPSTITCNDHPSSALWNYAVWQYNTSRPSDGNKCRRNAETHGPTCPRDPLGANDSMRGSISWGEPAEHRIYQTVTVQSGVAYLLTGFWAGGNDTGTAGTFKVELRDGAGFSGAVLGSYGGTIPASSAFGWTQFSVTGTPASGQMTVVVDGNVQSWGAHSIHVDGLVLDVAPCTTPPTITEPVPPATNPTPDHGGRGSTLTGVQVSGSNFVAGNTSVLLARGATEIAATNVQVTSSTTLTCDLSLAGAGAGYWDLVVRKPGCPDGLLLNAFLVVLSGPNLTNGSFELPTAAGGCPVTEQGAPTDWAAIQFDFYLGGENGSVIHRDEASTYPPSCPPPDGQHYASTRGGTDRSAGTMRLMQTITVTPNQPYTLTGFFAGGGPNTVSIAMLDGGQDAGPIGGMSQAVVHTGSDVYDWKFGYVSGTPTTDILTVRWEVGNNLDGAKSASVDNLTLVPCTAGVGLTGLLPAAAANDAVLTGATITGSGFSGGTPTIYLVSATKSVPGTNVNVAGDNTITCDFNLTGAPGGAYDLIVGNHGCFVTLTGALVAAPSALVNGEFEDPTADQNCGPPPAPILGVPTGWSALAPAEFTRDNNVYVPTCPCPDSQGGHYAAMSTGFGHEQRGWQTLKVVTGRSYRFEGWFAGGGSNTVTIKLVDGVDPTAAALAETTVATPTGGGYDWQHAAVQAHAASDIITVVWEMTGSQDGTANTTHADGLTFETPCNSPFADTDGDGDVDQADFAVLQACYTGPGAGPVPATPEYCKCLDVEGAGGQPDNDIDQADLNRFEACASGPGILADPGCD